MPHYAPVAPGPSPHVHSLRYRPDVEGLRAVAILLVVAAHAGIPGLAGGFVGVDVFFVLSGYLITGLLLQEVGRTGRIDMLAFYARRLRRLLPALLLVVATTAVAASVLLAPFEQAEQATTAGAAAAWISNLLFAFSKLDYFGPAAEKNLFLHTWSLGVEEQFYLAWPVLVLFLLGAMRWQGGGCNHARLRRGMVAVAAISFAYCLLTTVIQPAVAFYTVPARAWQFAVGALTFIAASQASTRLPALVSRVGGMVGLGMLIATALVLDGHEPYPGYRALFPSAGAVLLLYSGAMDQDHGAARLLATPAFQGIGRISYGWYLWHWPVLLLGATVSDPRDPLHVGILVALSLALAFASYHLVEHPIRTWRALWPRPGLTIASSIVLIAATCAAILGWRTAAGGWMRSPEQLRFQQARLDAPALYSRGCDDWYHSARVKGCVFGAADSSHTVVVFGDSVALQWFPAIQRAYARAGWRLIVLTKSACPMVDEPYFYPRIGREYTECSIWRDAAIELIATLRPDVIVTGSAAYGFSRSQWVEGTTRVLRRLSPAARERVFVLQATPRLPMDGPACLSRQAWRPAVFGGEDACAWPANNPALESIQSWITGAAKPFANVTVLDLDGLACPSGRCSATDKEQLVFRDSQHLTATFAASVAPQLHSLLFSAASAPLEPSGARSLD